MNEINESVAGIGIKFTIRTEYTVEYMEQITEQYKNLVGLNSQTVGLVFAPLKQDFCEISF